ncbi:MAG: riboflavin kinase [Candidatus Bathyarchaeota archaeon B26-1]|nr:MAG: riboflavin kinase [Candidatus Bathyarchaeota archaeon B26-1]
MNQSADERKLHKYFFILYRLAEMGAYNRTIKASTEFLAERLGVSQQTASRYLVGLERVGWIKRIITAQGTLVRLSEEGKKQLKRVHSGLSVILEAKYPPSLTIEGTVFSGLGEGAYYVTREAYRRQFIEKLGFDPYPGTLNLKLTTEYDVEAAADLESYPAIVIEGFKDESRTYGPVRCFHALVNNREKGAVVMALRSHYNMSVLEVIAPVYLRGKLKLKDGSRVKVTVLVDAGSDGGRG